MNQSKSENLGNKLHGIIRITVKALFDQGESMQLSYNAFDHIAASIKGNKDEDIEISYPVGYSETKQPMLSTKKYKKDDLIGKYSYLAETQLAINGTYQLVTTIEAMLGDIIRAIVIKHPHKLGKKRSVSTSHILEASTLEEIHHHAVDSILNDLSYKSPHDFAKDATDILSINLLECPTYHKYIEIKATRDIFVHNRGIANATYVSKAGSHARTDIGKYLPIDSIYFMESYECCLKFSEWLEAQFHDIWHSSDYEKFKEEIAPPAKS